MLDYLHALTGSSQEGHSSVTFKEGSAAGAGDREEARSQGVQGAFSGWKRQGNASSARVSRRKAVLPAPWSQYRELRFGILTRITRE